MPLVRAILQGRVVETSGALVAGALITVQNDATDANSASLGNVVNSPAFGTVTRTLPRTGEDGSSPQMQRALRLSF